jgi:hypothetical protein
MADPSLTPFELRLLDFFISEAQATAADVDWEAFAQAAHDVMQNVPLRMAGDTHDYKISEKVRKALAEALSTPGISLEELIRIRKIIRIL